jgi:hypothetical protein
MCVFDGIKQAKTVCVFLKRLRKTENFIRQSKLFTLTGSCGGQTNINHYKISYFELHN